MLVQVVGQSLGSLGDGVNVHPVGAGADDAPQAAGAEGKIAIKSVLHLGVVHGFQFGGHVGI